MSCAQYIKSCTNMSRFLLHVVCSMELHKGVAFFCCTSCGTELWSCGIGSAPHIQQYVYSADRFRSFCVGLKVCKQYRTAVQRALLYRCRGSRDGVRGLAARWRACFALCRRLQSVGFVDTYVG